MTPDIQALKNKALTAADLANHLNGIYPYTLLALIEIAEAAEEVAARLETRGFPVSYAARPSLIRDGARETVALDEAAIRLRTALEGVKK